MAGSTCPVCGHNDAVLSVLNIVSDGISSSTSFGVGYIDRGLAPMVSVTQTRSGLAERLRPPAPPGYLSWAGVFVPCTIFTLAAGFVFGDLWFGPAMFANWISLILSWFVGLFGGLLASFPFLGFWYLIHWHPVKKRQWRQLCSYLAGSYYCARDDLVFDAVENYGAPESYIPRLFASVR